MSFDNSKILTGWTPITTRILKQKGSSSWNFFDDPDGGRADRINGELESSGVKDHLLSSKTVSESKSETINDLLAQVMGSDSIAGSPAPIRGDKSMFIHRSVRKTEQFQRLHPHLASWITSVEATAAHYMKDSMRFDFSRTSVQLAEYPGDGTSCYPSHLDSKGTRLLTVIYYLNPKDWCPINDGGCLRIISDDDDDLFSDIPPYAGRTVVFRSDAVHHAVQPSHKRPRRALTIWLYGTTIEKSITNFRRVVSVRTPISESPSFGPPPLDCSPSTEAFSPPTIFVSIASYRDSETGPTIRHLMNTAKFPKRVSIGLVLQIDTTETSEDRETILQTLPQKEIWWKEQVKVLQLDAMFSTGPCNARAMAQTLWRNEDYFLQIDAHMRFRKNWDVYLIETLHKCPVPERSMLTAYPVGYTLPNNVPNETRGTLLVPWKFGSDGMLRSKGRLFQEDLPVGNDQPVACHLYAAGFNFAKGKPFPYDGSLHHMFFGEEISMAVRLFTSGYDTFAPTQSVVYHLWTRDHRPPSLAPRNPTQAEQSLRVVKEQLRGEEVSPFGLGSKRSVREFEQTVGVDFGSLKVTLFENEEENARLERVLGSDVTELLLGTTAHGRPLPKLLDDRATALIRKFLN